MSQTRGDALIADYLDRVRAAAAGLDPARREELIQDLREHIDAARAELSPETEAGVRTILDRLGDPAVIAAEASVGEAPLASSAPRPPAAPAKSRKGWLTLLIVAVALFFLVPVTMCVIGALSYFVLDRDSPTEQHGPVTTIPVPSPRPS